MINLYDGNNVMRRAMDKGMPTARPMTLRMRYAQTTPNDIWVWDGRDHNQFRRDIYAPYKMNREPCPEDIFAQINLFRDLLKLSTATQICVHGWEADDIIGTLVRKRPHTFNVHSNDMDYGQIAHICTLHGCNLKGVPARWVPLYKAMNGDTSDNISGIPNFGPKAWLRLEEHWPQVERAIRANDPAGFVGLPFTKGVAAWLTVPENIELLRAMLTVTHFHNVPDDEIEGGIVKSVFNPQEADRIMSEFFL